MENAIVAVSNGQPTKKAVKFCVSLSAPFGNRTLVLANEVYFKDGLVLMEGVIGMVIAEPKVERIRLIESDSKHNGWATTSVRVCSTSGRCATNVEYGREYANLIVDRKNVGTVEGLENTLDLTLPWFRTKDEAQKMVDDAQIRLNDCTRKDNAEKIDEIAGLRRVTRAYKAWKALPWLVRVFKNSEKFIDNFPASIDDRAWVVTQADKLNLDYGA